jgi:glucosamine--fructose-6-phosphate aminotransferase (isomerizing)
LLLAAAYFGEWQSAQTELERTAEAIEHSMRSGPLAADVQLPFRRRTTYFLGRGFSLASVHMGALLMHEMARLPAVGMSTAQFRHGPVEVLSNDFQAIVFGSQPTTMRMDRKLAEDLSCTGALVGWIGSPTASSNVVELCSWPTDMMPRLAPLLEIIPVQFIALRLAESGGIEPGQFRFAAPITLSETEFLCER